VAGHRIGGGGGGLMPGHQKTMPHHSPDSPGSICQPPRRAPSGDWTWELQERHYLSVHRHPSTLMLSQLCLYSCFFSSKHVKCPPTHLLSTPTLDPLYLLVMNTKQTPAEAMSSEQAWQSWYACADSAQGKCLLPRESKRGASTKTQGSC